MISIIDQEWQLQLALKQEREEAREEGRNEGREEGRDEERDENALITDYLLDQGRYDDLRRVNKDKEFRQQILDEMNKQ